MCTTGAIERHLSGPVAHVFRSHDTQVLYRWPMARPLDSLDMRVLILCLTQPRAGVREYARTLGVARGTVQARLDKLEEAGVLDGWAPTISPSGLGFGTLAYLRLNLAQGVLDEVAEALRSVPEVMEADTIAGESDLMCQVVARNAANLEEVIQRILAIPGVIRTRTETVLRRRISRRTLPLIRALARELDAEQQRT